MTRILLVLALVLTTGIAFSREVTIRDVIMDKQYWPPECSATTCVLSGPGGLIFQWLDHVRDNMGKKFIVRGWCASACEMAYRYARDHGANVRIAPGAQLVPHHVPGEYLSPH